MNSFIHSLVVSNNKNVLDNFNIILLFFFITNSKNLTYSKNTIIAELFVFYLMKKKLNCILKTIKCIRCKIKYMIILTIYCGINSTFITIQFFISTYVKGHTRTLQTVSQAEVSFCLFSTYIHLILNCERIYRFYRFVSFKFFVFCVHVHNFGKKACKDL